MSKYDGDWATREVAKTCAKYFANRAIKAGEREPRANYRHVAENSAKRNPNGRRGPKYGKSALRNADDTRTGSASLLPNTPTDLTPSSLLNQTADDPPEPSPHDTGPNSAAESTMLSPRSPNPHVVNRWHTRNPFLNAYQVQEPNGPIRHHSPHPHSHPHLDLPFAGPSQEVTVGPHYYPRQTIQNPAFTEGMHRFKQDRSLSPFWNVDEASGSGSRRD